MESLRELLSRFDELEEEDIFENVIKNGQTPDIVFAGLLNILDSYEVDDLDSYCDEYVHASIDRVFTLVASASENHERDAVKEFLCRSVIKLITKKPDMIDTLVKVFRQSLEPISEPEQVPEDKEPKKREWIWPVVHHGSGSGKGDSYDEFREFFALKMFNYTVGKKGWLEANRHQFLADFMEMELPEEVEKEFGNKYGEPMTTDRLRKVANVIASTCSLNVAKNNPYLDQAISDWKNDLDFLKKKYYEDAGLNSFPWPDPDNQ